MFHSLMDVANSLWGPPAFMPSIIMITAKLKTHALTAIVAAIYSGSFNAQAQSRPAVPPNAAQLDQEWEYIVVSYGKTLFVRPQKMLAYPPLGLSRGSESPEWEANLDIMGRFGWEIVAIVGTSGGDDHHIFLKRRYDKARSANENEIITQAKEESRRQAEANRNKPKLIDLDAVDDKAVSERKFASIEKSYTDAFQKLEIAPTSTIAVKRRHEHIDIEIRADLTSKFLKNGNTYRSEEAANLTFDTRRENSDFKNSRTLIP